MDKLISTINEKSNNDTPYRTPELIELSKQVYLLEISDMETFECDKFIVYKHYVELQNKQRCSYLVKIPKK